MASALSPFATIPQMPNARWQMGSILGFVVGFLV
jgi:hypothetical protein